MDKIGIIYGPSKGRTATVAQSLQTLIGKDRADLIPVDTASIETIMKYDKLIFGVSTLGSEKWETSGDANQWGSVLPQIKKTDFKGKKVALFGLGDHITYATKFVDAMGEMAIVLKKQNAEIVGHVSPEDYTFTESKAFVDNRFVGLPIDEDNESDKTNERLIKWSRALTDIFFTKK